MASLIWCNDGGASIWQHCYIFSEFDGNNYSDYYDSDDNLENDDDDGKIYKSETVALVLIPKSPVHRCPLIFCRRRQRPTTNVQQGTSKVQHHPTTPTCSIQWPKCNVQRKMTNVHRTTTKVQHTAFVCSQWCWRNLTQRQQIFATLSNSLEPQFPQFAWQSNCKLASIVDKLIWAWFNCTPFARNSLALEAVHQLVAALPNLPNQT